MSKGKHSPTNLYGISVVKTSIGPWKISPVSIISGLEKKVDEENVFGLCTPKTMSIQVKEGLARCMEQQTVLHEIVHTTEFMYGISLTETEVDCIASNLLYVLKNNPELVKYLVQEGGNNE